MKHASLQFAHDDDMSALARPMSKFGTFALSQRLARRAIPRTASIRLGDCSRPAPMRPGAQQGGAGADYTPASYARGEAHFSRYYPPEARDFTYTRHIMIAVDGSKESEDCVRFVIRNFVKSGDLLHLVHIAVPDSVGIYLTPPGTEFNLDIDYEARDEFWRNAVKKTELFLDSFCDHVTHDMETCGGEMTPFTPPIELDAILDLTWEPVGELLLKKAKAIGVEFVCVTQHHKSWLEKILYGSVSSVLIGNNEDPPMHVFVFHAPKREEKDEPEMKRKTR